MCIQLFFLFNHCERNGSILFFVASESQVHEKQFQNCGRVVSHRRHWSAIEREYANMESIQLICGGVFLSLSVPPPPSQSTITKFCVRPTCCASSCFIASYNVMDIVVVHLISVRLAMDGNVSLWYCGITTCAHNHPTLYTHMDTN